MKLLKSSQIAGYADTQAKKEASKIHDKRETEQYSSPHTGPKDSDADAKRELALKTGYPPLVEEESWNGGEQYQVMIDEEGADYIQVDKEADTQGIEIQGDTKKYFSLMGEAAQKDLSIAPQSNYVIPPAPVAGAKSFTVNAQTKYGNLIELYAGIQNRPEIISVFKAPVTSNYFDNTADGIISLFDIANFEKRLRMSNLELVFESLEALHSDKMKLLSEQREQIFSDTKSKIQAMITLREAMDKAKEALNQIKELLEIEQDYYVRKIIELTIRKIND